MASPRSDTGFILRLNLPLRWGYLSSSDRSRMHPFHFEQVDGYVAGGPFPIEVGQAVRYRVEGLRVTEVFRGGFVTAG